MNDIHSLSTIQPETRQAVIDMANLSELTYKKVLIDWPIYKKLAAYDVQAIRSRAENNSGLLCFKGLKMLLAYRGTQTTLNAISDTNILQRDLPFSQGKVHDGFYRGFYASKKSLDTKREAHFDSLLKGSLLDSKKLLSDVRAVLNSSRILIGKNKQWKADFNLLKKTEYLENQINSLRENPTDNVLRDVLHYAVIKQMDITITGHSLGGAMATIAALYFAKKYDIADNIQIYSFGSPRVFNSEGAKAYDAILKKNTIRVSQFAQDPVTSLPPVQHDYKHVGRMLPLFEFKIFVPHKLQGYLDMLHELPEGSISTKLQDGDVITDILSKYSPLLYLHLLWNYMQQIILFLRKVKASIIQTFQVIRQRVSGEGSNLP